VNASSLTAGNIHGPNLDINLNNGQVTFQKGRLYSTTGSIDMNIDQGYLAVGDTKKSNHVLIRNGEIAFTQYNIFAPSESPYLRITNEIINGSFSSSTIQARDGLELNAKGHGSNPVPNIGVQTLAGVQFGKGNSGKLEETLVGGANVGVVISGGTLTTAMVNASPYIRVGSSADGHNPGNTVVVQAEYFNSKPTYAKTSSRGANVYVDGDGSLVRSTSARKYKTNIKHDVSLIDSEKLLGIPLSTWDDKAELKRTGKSDRYFGMIAEDLADAGLDYLVIHDENGEVEGIEYARVSLLLIPMIRQLKEELAELKENTDARKDY